MRDFVTVFEVGPRDGLQNESRPVSLSLKLKLVRGLITSGVREIELGAFVRPDLVPQMADTDLLFKSLDGKLGKCRAWSLVPNLKGMRRAIRAGAKNFALFTAASETFNRKNIKMSIAESLKEQKILINIARANNMNTRGYISTAFGCPFEGKISPSKTLKVLEKMARLGFWQISIGDTIGVATPKNVEAVLKPALRFLKPEHIAVHFHDTRGTALANTLRALELGVRTIDSSAGGLGGCPFALGASGNLATEDLVYFLNGMGMKTGIDLDKLCGTSLEFFKRIKRPLSSKYLQAYAARHHR